MFSVSIIDNVKTREYFFTKDHCQTTKDENLIPITYYLSYRIHPREGFKDGLIRTKTDLKRFLDSYHGREILNPDPEFQA